MNIHRVLLLQLSLLWPLPADRLSNCTGHGLHSLTEYRKGNEGEREGEGTLCGTISRQMGLRTKPQDIVNFGRNADSLWNHPNSSLGLFIVIHLCV